MRNYAYINPKSVIRPHEVAFLLAGDYSSAILPTSATRPDESLMTDFGNCNDVACLR